MTRDTSSRGLLSRLRGPRLVFFSFVALALVLLVMEHRAHLYPFLPFAILLLCPVIHLFGHGGHGHGGGGDAASPTHSHAPHREDSP